MILETISFSGISFCGIILWNYEFHKTIFFVEFCTKFHKIFPQIWIFHKFILWNFFPQIKFCGKTKRSVFHISICGCVERRQSLSASTNILWWRNPALEPCRKLVQACMSQQHQNQESPKNPPLIMKGKAIISGLCSKETSSWESACSNRCGPHHTSRSNRHGRIYALY